MLLILAMLTPASAADFQAGLEAFERGDFATVVREWRPLAEQGHATAQYLLGGMYKLGVGLPQNNAEAAKWFRKAAEQGITEAQNYLGLMYANGEGVPKNNVQAYAWLNITAAQGEKNAKEVKAKIAEVMTYEELAHARELSREYWEAYVLPFRR